MANSIEWAQITVWSYTDRPGDFSYDGSENEGPALSFGDRVVVEAANKKEMIETLQEIIEHISS